MMQVDAVSQSSAASIAGTTSLDQSGMGKEAFLRLLVAQLRHQNPLEPIGNTEFLAQLSQFSSLEQLYNVNETLARNGDLTLSVHNALMTNLIGKDVKVQGNVLQWTENSEVKVAYEMVQGGEVFIQVFDDQGLVVRNIGLGPQNEGSHLYGWDGKDNEGNRVSPGNYSVRVLKINAEGAEVDLPTYLIGRVTGIQYLNGNPVLCVGDQVVNPSDVIAIYEPSDT